MKTLISTRRLLGFTIPCAVLALLLASAPAGVVTNTGDSGPGSLRQAIADADSGTKQAPSYTSPRSKNP